MKRQVVPDGHERSGGIRVGPGRRLHQGLADGQVVVDGVSLPLTERPSPGGMHQREVDVVGGM